MSRNTPQLIQRLLLAAGIVLLGVYAVARLDGWLSSRRALSEFDRRVASEPAVEDSGKTITKGLTENERVDFSLWSEQRVRGYKESLFVEKVPWAVLGISKLGLRVPVFDGTDDVTLNRGAGWIAGTARPGDGGNVGIAGHRDGFFRGLKDIAAGDAIALTTPQEQATYLVDEIVIVTPEHVEVLDPRGSPSLTLVTCYPFYFVGDAPQRFIVHATLARTVATKSLN
jgi:sortase A